MKLEAPSMLYPINFASQMLNVVNVTKILIIIKFDTKVKVPQGYTYKKNK